MSDGWNADDIPDQSGRVLLVTGANSGLGLETVKAVSARGARVVLAVRNVAKGEAAAAAVAGEVPGADLAVRRLDLADLDSVRAFSESFDERIDVLVNNAGIMAAPRSLTPQGNESQFATNHLGHFALTGLLLDRVGGPDPRVVTLASLAHRGGEIRFDDLTGQRGYSATGYYGQSKLANLLFGLELDRRLRAAGSPVKSVVAHPGIAATDLMQSVTPVLRFFGSLVVPLLTQPAADGALPQLYAATDPRAEGGQYIGPDGRGERKGHPVVVRPSEKAQDPVRAKRLWDVSERLTGVAYALPAAA